MGTLSTLLRTLILMLVLLFTGNLYPQYAGTYSVGDSTSFFATPQDAFDSLSTHGVSDTVILLIAPGTYPGVTVGAIPGTSALSPVICQSELADSTTVIFEGSTTIYAVDFLHFDRVSFISWNTTSETTLYIENSEVTISNSIIQNPYPIAYTSSNGLIRIKYPNSPAVHKTIEIEGCLISANGTGIQFANGIYGNANFRNNTISTDFSSSANNPVCLFIGNIFTLHKNLDLRNAIFEGNAFHPGSSSMVTVRAVSFNSNTVYTRIRVNSNKIFGNSFYERFNTSDYDNALIIGNTFFDLTQFTSQNNPTIARNVFHGSVVVRSDNLKFAFNHLYDTLTLNQGNTQLFINNSFAPDGLLRVRSTKAIIQNNIIAGLDIVQLPLQIKNNNYITNENQEYSKDINYDSNPYFHDPYYLDKDTLIHATNPSLAAKGADYFIHAKYDFDSTYIPALPPIGANVICLDLSNTDTLYGRCNEVLSLKSCTPGIVWDSASGIYFGSFHHPYVKAEVSQYVRYTDTINNTSDSIYLNIIPWQHITGPRTLDRRCETNVQLVANGPSEANFQWSPGATLNDSTIKFPIALPEDTTLYIARVDMGACGMFYDTIMVNIDHTPQCIPIFDSIIGTTVYFMAYATCADSFLWHFGDGNSSTDENPIHHYQASGAYLVELMVWNAHASHSCEWTYYLQGIGISDPEIRKFRLFPNPAQDVLNVETPALNPDYKYEIMDGRGRIVTAGMLTSSHSSIPVSLLNAGIYLIRISNHEFSETHQFVKVK